MLVGAGIHLGMRSERQHGARRGLRAWGRMSKGELTAVTLQARTAEKTTFMPPGFCVIHSGCAASSTTRSSGANVAPKSCSRQPPTEARVSTRKLIVSYPPFLTLRASANYGRA